MNAAYNPAAWSSFFSAQVSASAALTGLIFVAVSINLGRIIAGTQLIPRCAQALCILMGVLLASTCGMIPGQPVLALGCEMTGLGVFVWLASTILHHRASDHNPYLSGGQRIFHTAFTQLSTLPFVAAGISLLAQRGGGLYWMAGGVVFAFVASLIHAWVLLIEIQR